MSHPEFKSFPEHYRPLGLMIFENVNGLAQGRAAEQCSEEILSLFVREEWKPGPPTKKIGKPPPELVRLTLEISAVATKHAPILAYRFDVLHDLVTVIILEAAHAGWGRKALSS